MENFKLSQSVLFFEECLNNRSKIVATEEFRAFVEKISKLIAEDSKEIVIKINPNDPKDKLNLNKISFNEYKRRMENFLLEQIYISGEFEKTLKQFISDARDEGNDDHKQEKSSESEEDGKSKNFEENSSVDEQKTKNSYLKKKTTKGLRNSEKSAYRLYEPI